MTPAIKPPTPDGEHDRQRVAREVAADMHDPEDDRLEQVRPERPERPAAPAHQRAAEGHLLERAVGQRHDDAATKAVSATPSGATS